MDRPETEQALPLPRHDGVPKYLLLRNSLVEAIANGRWKEGDRLPSEDALVQLTGLSLGTVQRSLRMLVEENRLVRRHGTGTFVAASEAPMKAPFQHCRFIDDESGEVLPIFSHVLRRRPMTQTGPWNEVLAAEPLLSIERVFSINKEFGIYTHLVFSANRFPRLTEVPEDSLENINFKDLLAREFHHPLARFTEKLSVRVFPAYVCKALKIKAGTSGGVMEIVAYDRQGEAVYFQDLYIPPNERRLSILP